VVCTSEGGEFCEQLLEEALWQVLDGGGDCGGQDYLAGDCVVWINGEESPVDVRAVADVRVVAFRCGVLEDGLQKLLPRRAWRDFRMS